jgi:hypothetical protein
MRNAMSVLLASSVFDLERAAVSEREAAEKAARPQGQAPVDAAGPAVSQLSDARRRTA